VKRRGRPNTYSSLETEIIPKKRGQLLLHFQLKMLKDEIGQSLLRRELIAENPIVVEFLK
jgi:hypothetical protein